MVVDMWSLSLAVQTLIVVAVTTVLVQCIRRVLAYRSFYNFFMSLPGEKDFSLLYGNLRNVQNMKAHQRREHFKELVVQFPKFFRMFLGPFNAMIMVHHPDTVKVLTRTAEPKPVMYHFAIPWLGEGLLLAEGDKWARSRRLITPAFHFDILKPYVAVSNRAMDILLGKIEKYAKEEKSIEMYSNISQCTLDIILRCSMTYTDDIQTQGESHPYVQAIAELGELWMERGRNPLVYNDFVYGLTKNGRRFKQQCQYIHSVSERIIRERQRTLERDGPPRKRYLDFLDILLTARDDTGQGLTLVEIRSEVDTFMFAGHDTTASAVSWILYSLCEHPEYQGKVQQEIDTILQGRDSDDIEWSDLSKLQYLTMVIKEGLRFHCPVPSFSRRLTEPAVVEGVTIPSGTTCNISLVNLHHNPLVWADPWTFDPDRFHPDKMKDKDNYAFIPFSAGPRNCMGQHFAMNEEKVMLSRLLRRFTFSLDPTHTVERKPSAVMRTESGMKMFAIPRTPTM